MIHPFARDIARAVAHAQHDAEDYQQPSAVLYSTETRTAPTLAWADAMRRLPPDTRCSACAAKLAPYAARLVCSTFRVARDGVVRVFMLALPSCGELACRCAVHQRLAHWMFTEHQQRAGRPDLLAQRAPVFVHMSRAAMHCTGALMINHFANRAVMCPKFISTQLRSEINSMQPTAMLCANPVCWRDTRSFLEPLMVVRNDRQVLLRFLHCADRRACRHALESAVVREQGGAWLVNRVCKNCHGPADSTCEACGIAAYCTKECARAQWPLHKDVCRRLKRTCRACERESDAPLAKCARCRVARYCDEACARADRREHRAKCVSHDSIDE